MSRPAAMPLSMFALETSLPEASSFAPLGKLIQQCAPQIHPETLTRIVLTESSANPYAIGVVGGRLERQPRSRQEAVATVNALRRQGMNFSAGLGQINVSNWRRLSLDERSVFDPCSNLRAAQVVLKDCFDRAPERRASQAGQGGESFGHARRPAEQQALRQAFSCYYSGNFVTGFGHGYVAKIVSTPLTSARSGRGGKLEMHSDPDLPERRRAGPDD